MCKQTWQCIKAPQPGQGTSLIGIVTSQVPNISNIRVPSNCKRINYDLIIINESLGNKIFEDTVIEQNIIDCIIIKCLI